MTKQKGFYDQYYTLNEITKNAEVTQQVRTMAGLLERHNLMTAIKMIELEFQIGRKDACLLVCEVAGELSALRKNPNIKGCKDE